MEEYEQEIVFDQMELLAWHAANIMRSNGMKVKPTKLFDRRKATLGRDKLTAEELNEKARRVFGRRKKGGTKDGGRNGLR